MPLDFLVPVEKREWKFFERQRSVFKSAYTSSTVGKTSAILEDDIMRSFDEELAKVKRDLFTLKAIDFGKEKDDFGINKSLADEFGEDFPFSKNSSALSKSSKMSARMDSIGKSAKDFGLSRELSDLEFDKDVDDMFEGVRKGGKTGSGRTVIESCSVSESYSSTTKGSPGSARATTLASGRDIDAIKSSPSSLRDRDLLLKVEHPVVVGPDGQKRLALRFDVSQFKPEEVLVKVRDSTLSVIAEHREETATSKVYKYYSRQYVLPHKISAEKLTSILSADGVLDIEGPAPEAETAQPIRLLPINLL